MRRSTRFTTFLWSLAAAVAWSYLAVAPTEVAAQLEPKQKRTEKQQVPRRAPGPSIPESPAKRAILLDDLYAHLATASDEESAERFAQAIERIWLTSGSDTVNVLMERALRAVHEKNPEFALKLLDTVVELAPDYAEGWNRRAYVYYTQNDFERALGDLRRVLALDPSHFKALDGLGQILREIGEKKAALQVYQRLNEVHPYWHGAKEALGELERDVGGRGL